MAECHPVGFQWVMEAKARGAKVIHVDPRFTRTSAVADLHVPHPGRQRHRLPRRRSSTTSSRTAASSASTCRRYTNASRDHRRGLPRHRGPRRPLLRLGRGDSAYDIDDLAVRGHGGRPRRPAARARARHGRAGARQPRRDLRQATRRSSDPTLEHPRCVFQLLKRHFARYTPELVEEVCGVPRRAVPRGRRGAVRQLGPRAHVGVLLRGRLDAAHRRRAVHPHRGDRPAAARQHRPARRRHPRAARPRVASRARPTSRRSTTSCPATSRCRTRTRTRRSTSTSRRTRRRRGFWGHMDAYIVSLLKAWWGDAATAENDFCFDYLPRIDGDHSTYATVHGDARRRGQGLLRGRREPGGRVRQRRGCTAWRSPSSTGWSCATSSRSRRRRSGTTRPRSSAASCARPTSAPRCSSCRPRRTPRRTAASPTPSGCCSGTQGGRAAGRLPLRPVVLLPPRPHHPREAGAARPTRRDRPLLDLTWDYPIEGAHDEPERRRGAARDQRLRPRRRAAVGVHRAARTTARPRAAAGSTAACYAGRRQPDRRAASPAREQTWVAPEWGWAWPANRRILYNRASADPDGRPWSERKQLRLVGRGSGRVDGRRRARLRRRQAARLRAAGRARAARTRIAGDEPFIMQADGRGWLFAPDRAASTARCRRTTSRTSRRSTNPLYGQRREPGAPACSRRPREPVQRRPATGRIPVRADHLPAHRAPHGRRDVAVPRRTWPSCSRRCSARCRPELAARARARARRLGDGRHRARRDRGAGAGHRPDARRCRAGPRRCTRSACRTTGARAGSARGDSANDLFPLVLDPNVHIQEVEGGHVRHPAGPADRAVSELRHGG